VTALVLSLLFIAEPPQVSGPDAPLYWKPGMTAPRMVEDNCVGERLTGVVPTSGSRGEALVKFVVRADGAVGEFAVMQGVDDDELARLIEAAVRRCAWKPGTDTDGRTATQWTVLPIRYDAAEDDDPARKDSKSIQGLTTAVEISPTNLSEAGKTPAGRSYFRRLWLDIFAKWDPMSAARSRDPTGNRFFSKSRQTLLKVTLDARGALVDAQVARSSGLNFLDQTALDAVGSAQPFDSPPPELLGEDGLLRFTFGFNVSAGRVK